MFPDQYHSLPEGIEAPESDTPSKEDVEHLNFILKENIADLTQEEITIINYRFLQEQPLTLRKIQDKIGVRSPERVRIRQNKALEKLKAVINIGVIL